MSARTSSDRKIGIFDSGLGGLFILRALARRLPSYDYVYLGDTARVPYGNRSPETVHRFLREAVDFLFKRGCELVIVACNTASAEALRKIQREYLPRHYPSRRVLGMIVPTVEAALADGGRGGATARAITRLGVLATEGTVRSNTYIREAKKIAPRVRVFQSAAPLLVPLVESGGIKWAGPVVREYLAPLRRARVEKVVLGCTHYPALKRMIGKMAGVPVVSQDELVPDKLKDYLKRHPEIGARLGKRGRRELLVTDITPVYARLARQWFGARARLRRVALRPIR